MPALRLVIDTDVLVSAVQSEVGASRIVLIAVASGLIVPVLSVPILLEYEDVLKRPDRLKAMGWVRSQVDDLLDDIAGVAQQVQIRDRRSPLVKDRADQMFVDALVESGAVAVVSFNVRDYLPADVRLASRGVTVVPVERPGDIVRRLGWRPDPATLLSFRRR